MAEGSQIDALAVAAQRGDSLALAELLAMYHPRLRARAEARMDPATKARTGADDVLQETYIEVFRGIDSFENRGPGSFSNWLYTILDHKIIDAHRAAHRRVREVALDVPLQAESEANSYWNLLDQLFGDVNTSSRVVRRHEALAALRVCLSDLSDDHRQVIQLRFLEGHSTIDVAAMLGKSEVAVISLTKRALGALRISMDRFGEFTRGS